MVAVPKKASSVILVRDTGKGIETFLVKRHAASSFMGGFYAFPGGNVEADDFSDQLLAQVEGISAEEACDMLGRESSPQIALAHWVAGMREVFEEVGILFAREEGGKPISCGDEKRKKYLNDIGNYSTRVR
jgi:8-oxo-dGTP pyrophosphatase MutT (NUDIX family)